RRRHPQSGCGGDIRRDEPGDERYPGDADGDNRSERWPSRKRGNWKRQRNRSFELGGSNGITERRLWRRHDSCVRTFAERRRGEADEEGEADEAKEVVERA